MTKLTNEEKVLKCVLFQIKISDPTHVVAKWENRKLFLMQQNLFHTLGIDETNRLMGEARKTLEILGVSEEKLIIPGRGHAHDWYDIRTAKF